ncbi:MAG: hypothetical protein HZA88_10030 [Verrucomicrobia bacterium]|nr:hypothetical protein [Verrucomicrobiota bacterium]
MKTISRNLLLLSMLWAVAGGTAWAGEKPATTESAQTIEQTERIIYGQYFDDRIAGNFEWNQRNMKLTLDPKMISIQSNSIARWSDKTSPLKLHYRLGGVALLDFPFDDPLMKRFLPSLQKETHDSLISRDKIWRELPLGRLATASGRTILIVSDEANSRKSVFGLSRVGFSRDGRQALLGDRFAFYLYQFVDGRWKQVSSFPYALD